MKIINKIAREHLSELEFSDFEGVYPSKYNLKIMQNFAKDILKIIMSDMWENNGNSWGPCSCEDYLKDKAREIGIEI